MIGSRKRTLAATAVVVIPLGMLVLLGVGSASASRTAAPGPRLRSVASRESPRYLDSAQGCRPRRLRCVGPTNSAPRPSTSRPC